MKASEAIAQLQRLMEAHGDLDVVFLHPESGLRQHTSRIVLQSGPHFHFAQDFPGLDEGQVFRVEEDDERSD
jgi:hypothetical protein